MLFRVLLMVVVLVLQAGVGAAKSLYWRDLTVMAHLDAEGKLHLRERHGMVFSGDWNGGERRFRVGDGQRLELVKITRVDARTGAAIALRQGDLGKVDHWDWRGGDTVRWRSRLPSDLAFNQTEITYELEYMLTGVLVKEGDGYRLNHDFAFPERAGDIVHFHLDLTLDPVWTAAPPLPAQVDEHGLAPGKSVVLSALLSRSQGEPAFFRPEQVQPGQQPDNARASVPPWLSLLSLVVTALALLGKAGLFLRHEQRLGRFVIPSETIDRRWIERNLLPLAPEVVGATWDKQTGAAEVAAVIARLVQEGKLASRVENPVLQLFGWQIPLPGGPILHLTLKHKRQDFTGYEKNLIAGLFIDGDSTSTRKVRDFYRNKNRRFDPAELVRKPLEVLVRKLVGTEITPPVLWSGWPTLMLFLAGIALLLAHAIQSGTGWTPQAQFVIKMLATTVLIPIALVVFSVRHPDRFAKQPWVAPALLAGWMVALFVIITIFRGQDKTSLLLPVLLLLLISWGISLIMAFLCRQRADRMRSRCTVLIALLLLMLSLMTLSMQYFPLSLYQYAGVMLLILAWMNAIFNCARSRDSAEGIAMRQKLAQARLFFLQQLVMAGPDLDDSWYPYLLAFGLGPQVDGWFKAYGSDAGLSSGHSGNSGATGGFSGGGGTFGGAGAAGDWGSAVSGLAAVSASSSSSSGSSSGGGSSGGGGGGGW